MVAEHLLDALGQLARYLDRDRHVVAFLRPQPSEDPAQVHAPSPSIRAAIFSGGMNDVAGVEQNRSRRHHRLRDFSGSWRAIGIAPQVASGCNLSSSGFDLEVA